MAALQARRHARLARRADRAAGRDRRDRLDRLQGRLQGHGGRRRHRPGASTAGSPRRCRTPGSRTPTSPTPRPTPRSSPTATASPGTRRSTRSPTSRRSRSRRARSTSSRRASARVAARCSPATTTASERGIEMYGGGQIELGVGRGQIQLLASLFHPDGVNDIAPVGLRLGRVPHRSPPARSIPTPSPPACAGGRRISSYAAQSSARSRWRASRRSPRCRGSRRAPTRSSRPRRASAPPRRRSSAPAPPSGWTPSARASTSAPRRRRAPAAAAARPPAGARLQRAHVLHPRRHAAHRRAQRGARAVAVRGDLGDARRRRGRGARRPHGPRRGGHRPARVRPGALRRPRSVPRVRPRSRRAAVPRGLRHHPSARASSRSRDPARRPFHARQAELGAEFSRAPAGSGRAGTSQRAADRRRALARGAWETRNWSPIGGAEHMATASAPASIWTSRRSSRSRSRGAGALAYLQRLAANDVDRPSGTSSTPRCSRREGGITCDLTVTRVAEEEFFVVDGGAVGRHDLADAPPPAAGRLGRAGGRDVGLCCLGLWGPRAQDDRRLGRGGDI